MSSVGGKSRLKGVFNFWEWVNVIKTKDDDNFTLYGGSKYGVEVY